MFVNELASLNVTLQLIRTVDQNIDLLLTNGLCFVYCVLALYYTVEATFGSERPSADICLH